MKTVNVATLIGPALDWAVAKCIGKKVSIRDGYVGNMESRHDYDPGWFQWFQPHKDWTQGGPIIEREHMEFDYDPWTQMYLAVDGSSTGQGKTHLIAAMRCYAVSKLGDTIEIPEELV